MLTRRERERAEANRAALETVRQNLAPHLRAAGFRKASLNTWRMDRPGIVVRYQLELGSPSQGPWAAVSGDLSAVVAGAPTPAKPFRECIFDSQLELAERETGYQLADEDHRTAFLDDFLEHSLPWLLRYDIFADLWRALLHAELPGLMTAQRNARPKWYAMAALEVAVFHDLDPDLLDEAIAYCWESGFLFDVSTFDEEMAEIVERLPTRPVARASAAPPLQP